MRFRRTFIGLETGFVRPMYGRGRTKADVRPSQVRPEPIQIPEYQCVELKQIKLLIFSNLTRCK